MKKICILAVVLATVSLSGCTTVFGEPEPPDNGVLLDPSFITDIISAINNEEINQIMDESEELNVNVYGVNGTIAQDIKNSYIKSHAEWTVQYDFDSTVANALEAYARAWSKTVYIHAVIIIGGNVVELASNYDVIVITSHGYFTVYQKYFDWTA